MLTRAGVADAKSKAQRIFDLETKIAGVHASVDDTSDPAKGNNHWSRADLDTKAPGMDWAAFLDAAKLGGQQGFVIWQPAAISGEAALVAALQAGRIAGAGLDVYEFEPKVPEALIAMENVTLLPHLGTACLEVRENMGLMAVDNLIAHLDGRALPNRV